MTESAQQLFSESISTILEKKTFNQWINDVKAIFDIQKFTTRKLSSTLLILGLNHIDSELREFLSGKGFIEQLYEEQKPAFHTLLADEQDPKIIHADSPLYEDFLGRNGFARALCIWLDNNWQERTKQESKEKDGKSFILQLGGPWGSGKTTLLNLMDNGFKCKKPEIAKELNNPILDIKGDWVTVWFNAWQNQHVSPAWLPLINKIFKESTSKLIKQYRKIFKGIRIILWEKIWRFSYGKTWPLIAFIISLSALVFIIFQAISNDFGTENIEKYAKVLASIFSVVGSVWAGALIFGKSLVSGSADSANLFLQRAIDPLDKIKNHFKKLIDKFDKSKIPIIVFIDDMDRCKPDYVVELFESLQTIFTHRNLFFVIAADRRWLYTSFETVFDDFTDKIVESGKRLGYLFLEKAIQTSVTIPRMSDDFMRSYLDYLHNYMPDKNKEIIATAREKARSSLSKIKDDSSLIKQMSRFKDDPVMFQAFREFAIEKSATKDITVASEYFLRKFSPLFEPNPRAMKRYVNAYNIYKTLAYTVDYELIKTEDDKKCFALWTILSLRWPKLAEILELEPEMADKLKNKTAKAKKGDKWFEFIDNKDIINVLKGKGIDAELNSKKIERLCKINPIVHETSMS